MQIYTNISVKFGNYLKSDDSDVRFGQYLLCVSEIYNFWANGECLSSFWRISQCELFLKELKT